MNDQLLNNKKVAIIGAGPVDRFSWQYLKKHLKKAKEDFKFIHERGTGKRQLKLCMIHLCFIRIPWL